MITLIKIMNTQPFFPINISLRSLGIQVLSFKENLCLGRINMGFLRSKYEPENLTP